MLEELLGLIGRAPKPDLPPVDALSPEDLSRMQFEALRSGDQGKVDRIAEIQRMRDQLGVPGQPQAQPELLRDTEDKRSGLLAPVRRAGDARQRLLDALNTRPQ